MKIPPSFFSPIALGVCLFAILALAIPATAAVEDWKLVDPAELALKTPRVEKEADAEGLFWEVRIEDSPEGDLIFNHYLRVKVFTVDPRLLRCWRLAPRARQVLGGNRQNFL